MANKQKHARLGKELSKYGVSWTEHMYSPVALFRQSNGFRQFWYKDHHFYETFTWWGRHEYTWHQLVQQNPELRAIIDSEHPEWLQGN